MKKKKFTLEVPGNAKEILLHTCCAPCSSAIIECLMQHDIRPTIYYCNPNIYPLEEYNIRKNECSRYAQSLGLDIIDADYNHEAWRCTVQGLEGEPERGGRLISADNNAVSSLNIVIAGSTPGAGATHLAFGLCVYLTKMGIKVLYEERNQTGAVRRMAESTGVARSEG